MPGTDETYATFLFFLIGGTARSRVERAGQSDSLCDTHISSALRHPRLPIVSQKLLLKEVFLYWSVNKLSIVPYELCKVSPSTTSLFVFARFQELSRFCVWHPMSVVGLEVKCTRSWMRSFLIALFPIILGVDALCLIDLGAFSLEPRKRYFIFPLLLGLGNKATGADIPAQCWKTALCRPYLMFYYTTLFFFMPRNKNTFGQVHLFLMPNDLKDFFYNPV